MPNPKSSPNTSRLAFGLSYRQKALCNRRHPDRTSDHRDIRVERLLNSLTSFSTFLNVQELHEPESTSSLALVAAVSEVFCIMSSNAVPSHDPTLLGLPLELLCKVFDELNDESLPSVRLACKDLDEASFDKFTHAFINVRACCILEEARWKLLFDILNRSPRLTDRLRELTFKDDRLELKDSRDLNTVVRKDASRAMLGFSQLQELMMASKAEEAAELQARSVGATLQPSASLIFRVMADIATKAPYARVKMDFDISHHAHRIRPDVQDTMLLAASAANVIVRSLELDYDAAHGMASFFDNISQIPQYSCTSSLHRLAYLKGNAHRPQHAKDYEQQLSTLCSIIQSTTELCELELVLYGWNGHTQRMPFPKARTVSNILLVANRLDHLRILSLSDTDMLAMDLITVLSRCKPQLTKLILNRISIETGWTGVLRLLSTMAKLSDLSCNLLVSTSLILNGRYGFVTFEDLPASTHGHFYSFTNREDVVMGLGRMLEQPLRYQALSDKFVRYWPDVN